MKELIYTKNNLEYAYFSNENGVLREIGADALSGTEQKLTQCSAAGITISQNHRDADAVYFDAGYQELRAVHWQYSTERDPRGYAEARFRTLPAVSPAFRADSEAFARGLYHALETVCEANTGSSGLILIQRNSLCPDDLPETTQHAVILLLCLMLPEMISERLIFTSQNGQHLPPLHPVPAPDNTPLFDESDMILLQMIRQCDSMETYRVLLRFVMQSVFHLPVEPQNPDAAFSLQAVRITAALWEKTMRPPISDLMDFLDSGSVEQMLRTLLTEQITPLWNESDGDALCEQYIAVLQILEPFSKSAVFGEISDLLALSAHRTFLTPQRAFRLLNTLHYLISDEDYGLVSDILAEPFLNIQNTAELLHTADETAPVSAGQIVSVLANAGKMQEMTALCRRLEQDALDTLLRFDGICADAGFREIEQTLSAVSAVSQVCGRDFAAVLRNQYVSGCRNFVQCQRLAPFYLKESAPIFSLLAPFAERRMEAFYLPLHPLFYQTLLHAVQYSDLSEYEQNALSALLEAYLPAGTVFYELCTLSSDAEPAYANNRSLNCAFEKLPDRLLNAVRICISPDARSVLRFLVCTLFANPVSALKTAVLFTEQRGLNQGKQMSKLFFYDPAPTDLHTYLTETKSGALLFLRSLFDAEQGIVPFRKPLLKRSQHTGDRVFEEKIIRTLSENCGLSRRAECDLRTEIQHASRIYNVLITQLQLNAAVPAFSQCIRSL